MPPPHGSSTAPWAVGMPPPHGSSTSPSSSSAPDRPGLTAKAKQLAAGGKTKERFALCMHCEGRGVVPLEPPRPQPPTETADNDDFEEGGLSRTNTPLPPLPPPQAARTSRPEPQGRQMMVGAQTQSQPSPRGAAPYLYATADGSFARPRLPGGVQSVDTPQPARRLIPQQLQQHQQQHGPAPSSSGPQHAGPVVAAAGGDHIQSRGMAAASGSRHHHSPATTTGGTVEETKYRSRPRSRPPGDRPWAPRRLLPLAPRPGGAAPSPSSPASHVAGARPTLLPSVASPGSGPGRTTMGPSMVIGGMHPPPPTFSPRWVPRSDLHPSGSPSGGAPEAQMMQPPPPPSVPPSSAQGRGRGRKRSHAGTAEPDGGGPSERTPKRRAAAATANATTTATGGAPPPAPGSS
ncbi:hypothetical protein GGR56DRAFT_550151 [Xylariaceae sp. FL0804]|nr:hypothetical protein GGR56DRAFT_550151 [Xylariaceae sp. FL0804]